MLTASTSSFLGITAADEYGGLAMGYQAHCTAMEELSRASGTSPSYFDAFSISTPPKSIS